MDVLDSGWASAVVAAIALIISAYSLYETSLRRPNFSLFVPPVIQYASPYTNSNFEVLGIHDCQLGCTQWYGAINRSGSNEPSKRTDQTILQRGIRPLDHGECTRQQVPTFCPVGTSGKEQHLGKRSIL